MIVCTEGERAPELPPTPLAAEIHKWCRFSCPLTAKLAPLRAADQGGPD
jgi:hypothetical protein